MSDMMSTLIWGLKAATGLEVYPAPKPANASVPCLTVQIISDPMQDHNHSAGASIHFSRIQVGHIGDWEVARPYVQTVQTYLEGNKTDFLAAISDSTYFERQEAEDLWSLIKGYFIQWKAV
jgi:hypothetical protein